MNIIREFINAGKSGEHIGKGNQYYEQQNYKEALKEYELAIQYQEDILSGINPALLEYVAMTHCQLGNLSKALQSLNLYRKLKFDKEFIIEAVNRMEYLIELLRNNAVEKINDYLSDGENKKNERPQNT